MRLHGHVEECDDLARALPAGGDEHRLCGGRNFRIALTEAHQHASGQTRGYVVDHVIFHRASQITAHGRHQLALRNLDASYDPRLKERLLQEHGWLASKVSYPLDNCRCWPPVPRLILVERLLRGRVREHVNQAHHLWILGEGVEPAAANQVLDHHWRQWFAARAC